ncbi:MAG: metal-dependent transcriptional regulator [Candidatus Brocadiia bacterium]
MTETYSLSPAYEDYLEAIARLLVDKSGARVGEIAGLVGVHKSTVSAAVKGLAEKGLVNYSPYEEITLTSDGKRIAGEIRRRHEVIREFLENVLSVDQETAEANACRMEHVMDADVLERLSFFAEFVQNCPRAGEDWLKKFRYYCKHEGHPPQDDQELGLWMKEFERKVRKREMNTGEADADSA